jgi:trk system potassium uptake protein TrkH
MQWYGGLGIVVLTLALIFRPGAVAKSLAATEGDEDDLVGGVRATARITLQVYSALTLGAVLLFLVLGASLFDAVLYALAAVSTGGFAPHDASLGGLGNWTLRGAVLVACLAGAVPLAAHHRAMRGRMQGLDRLQVTTLLAAFAGITLLMLAGLALARPEGWEGFLLHAPFMALSAQTTAGFSTMDPALLDAASQVVLILSMFLGGCLGSTAGGIKILRLLIFLRLAQLLVVRLSVPRHAVLKTYLAGKEFNNLECLDTLLIVGLFLTVVAGSWICFLLAGHQPLASLFEVVSATGTVGLSTGVSAGLQDGVVPGLLKGVLCLDMLMGRLEILAWLMVFYPRTWFGRRYS